MMVVRLMGGLGNQMFQCAFGASVGKVRGEEVTFSYTPNWRPYGLGAFSADVRLTGETSAVFLEPGFGFCGDVYAAPPNMTYVGYWQTERYFDRELVRRAFVLRNGVSDKTRAAADDILSDNNSAFLHIRRTDYLNKGTAEYHGRPSPEYYAEAMGRIRACREDVRFFVFSDDPEWCRAEFAAPEFKVIDHSASAPHEDIYLMGLCRDAILANSSFSWWGAWLSPHEKGNKRLVFAPKRWFLADVDTPDRIPERWTKL
jgi:hypothetical protein